MEPPFLSNVAAAVNGLRAVFPATSPPEPNPSPPLREDYREEVDDLIASVGDSTWTEAELSPFDYHADILVLMDRDWLLYYLPALLTGLIVRWPRHTSLLDEVVPDLLTPGSTKKGVTAERLWHKVEQLPREQLAAIGQAVLMHDSLFLEDPEDEDQHRRKAFWGRWIQGAP